VRKAAELEVVRSEEQSKERIARSMRSILSEKKDRSRRVGEEEDEVVSGDLGMESRNWER
jgi:hypothetical protein